jgi:serine/threonine protein phosphatase PrpC
LASVVRHRNIVPQSSLAIAAQDANRSVYAVYRGGGGGTLSAFLLDGRGGLIGVSIGDSRIYCYRENRIDQLTVDDTRAGLQSEPNLDSRGKYALLQYVGMGDGMDPHIVERPLPWERILLTSDGAHCFDENLMQMVFQQTKDPGATAGSLIEVARWCGGYDNASLAVVGREIVRQQLSDCPGLVRVWDPHGELQMIVANAETPRWGPETEVWLSEN